MKDILQKCVNHVASELRAADDKMMRYIEDPWYYGDAAQNKINTMSNTELLELIELVSGD